MSEGLLMTLNGPAIEAYFAEGSSPRSDLAMLGAVMALHGIAENGGLVGGAIENLVENGEEQDVSDAVMGFRHLGLDDAAELVERAAAAFPSLRAEADETDGENPEVHAAWEALDEEYFATVPSGLIEAALRRRLPGLVPESMR